MPELPRNFDDPKLSIRVDHKEVETFSIEEVGTLLPACPDKTRLHLLLMLNRGMTQKDISDLHPKQINWKTGRIIRKRSKTGNWKSVPVVDYRLWPETFALLRQHRSKDPERVLLNARGGPLKIEERTKSGKLRKSDSIRTAYMRVCRKLKIAEPKTLKIMRKTSSSLVATRTDNDTAGYFLGHAPKTTAEKHYLAPSREQFDAVIDWLRDELKIEAACNPDPIPTPDDILATTSTPGKIPTMAKVTERTESLGRLLRARRVARKLSANELAELVGCSSAYISRFELGHAPSVTMLCRPRPWRRHPAR